MPIGALGAAAIGAGTSLLGGLFGSSAAKKARKQQMALLAQAQGQLSTAIDEIPGMRDRYLSEVDQANMLLAGVEPAILQGFDEAQRVRIAQQMRQSQAERQMQQQRLATAGLDTTTVAPNVSRGQAMGQSQQAAQIASQFAAARGSAQAQARQARAQGQMMRAQGLQFYDQMQANLRGQKSQQYYGTQVAPDTTGADIGAIGAGISEMLLNYSLQQQLGGNSGPAVTGLPGSSTSAYGPYAGGYQFPPGAMVN